MRLPRLAASDSPDDTPFSRRAVALVLTVLAHVGLLLLLLSLAPERVFVPVAPPPGTLTVTLTPAEEEQAAQSRRAKAAPQAGEQPHAAPPRTPPTPAPPLPEPAPESKALPGVLFLSKADLTAADISRLPQGQKQAEAGAGEGPGDTPAAGTGRNGQPLYAAEWVREPRDAEINGYLRRGGPPKGAWAEIACQTVARNRVDNCEALGDSPPGSGLAYAMTEAAWQFLVRPPRVGGRTLVGTWVRIRISWNRGEAPGG